MGFEDAKADIKEGARDIGNDAKETWRKADGEESLSDKVANAGDDIRDALGNAGDETGASMRRGLVAVGGSTGCCTLLSTIAGTVLVCGAIGADAALWNKRGSLIALGSVEPSATYRYACIIQPVYLRLLLRRLREVHGLPVTAAHIDGQFRRFSGDFSETGRGEILAWSPA